MNNTFVSSGFCRTFLRSIEFVSLLVAGSILSGAPTSFAAPTDAQVLDALGKDGARVVISQMAETGAKLASASENYCQKKDKESLTQAQQAWKAAYIAWSGSAPFRIGPVKDLQLYKRIGLWRSNDTIFKGATGSSDFKSMLQKPELRGYAGSEYILFASDDPSAKLSCSHLTDVTKEIATLTAKAVQSWETYEEGFINAGDGMPFMLASEAMSPVVAEILNTTEQILRDRIGLPSNFFKGEAKPELLEAWHSGNTGTGLDAAIDGLKTALDGNAPNSLIELLATKDGLVKKKNPKLAKAIRTDLEKIDHILAKINKDKAIYDQLEKKSTTMKKLYKRMQKLEKKLLDLSLGLELDVRSGLEAQLIRQQ